MPRSKKSNPLLGDWGYARASNTNPGGLGVRVPGGRRKHKIPEISTIFGELRVESYELGSRAGVSKVNMSCSCKRDSAYPVDIHNLLSGKSTRCRPCSREKANKSRKKYWGYADIVPDRDHRERLLNRICSIFSRCLNPKSKAFLDYGGRGIKLEPDFYWGRRAFLAYLISLPGWDDPKLEIDRIENDLGYSKGNIRFANRSAQNRNKRHIRTLQTRIMELEDTCEALKKENESLRLNLLRSSE